MNKNKEAIYEFNNCMKSYNFIYNNKNNNFLKLYNKNEEYLKECAKYIQEHISDYNIFDYYETYNYNCENNYFLRKHDLTENHIVIDVANTKSAIKASTTTTKGSLYSINKYAIGCRQYMGHFDPESKKTVKNNPLYFKRLFFVLDFDVTVDNYKDYFKNIDPYSHKKINRILKRKGEDAFCKEVCEILFTNTISFLQTNPWKVVYNKKPEEYSEYEKKEFFTDENGDVHLPKKYGFQMIYKFKDPINSWYPEQELIFKDIMKYVASVVGADPQFQHVLCKNYTNTNLFNVLSYTDFDTCLYIEDEKDNIFKIDNFEDKNSIKNREYSYYNKNLNKVCIKLKKSTEQNILKYSYSPIDFKELSKEIAIHPDRFHEYNGRLKGKTEEEIDDMFNLGIFEYYNKEDNMLPIFKKLSKMIVYNYVENINTYTNIEKIIKNRINEIKTIFLSENGEIKADRLNEFNMDDINDISDKILNDIKREETYDEYLFREVDYKYSYLEHKAMKILDNYSTNRNSRNCSIFNYLSDLPKEIVENIEYDDFFNGKIPDIFKYCAIKDPISEIEFEHIKESVMSFKQTNFIPYKDIEMNKRTGNLFIDSLNGITNSNKDYHEYKAERNGGKYVLDNRVFKIDFNEFNYDYINLDTKENNNAAILLDSVDKLRRLKKQNKKNGGNITIKVKTDNFYMKVNLFKENDLLHTFANTILIYGPFDYIKNICNIFTPASLKVYRTMYPAIGKFTVTQDYNFIIKAILLIHFRLHSAYIKHKNEVAKNVKNYEKIKLNNRNKNSNCSNISRQYKRHFDNSKEGILAENKYNELVKIRDYYAISKLNKYINNDNKINLNKIYSFSLFYDRLKNDGHLKENGQAKTILYYSNLFNISNSDATLFKNIINKYKEFLDNMIVFKDLFNNIINNRISENKKINSSIFREFIYIISSTIFNDSNIFSNDKLINDYIDSLKNSPEINNNIIIKFILIFINLIYNSSYYYNKIKDNIYKLNNYYYYNYYQYNSYV